MIDKDEIILSCQDRVANWVRKYHNPNFEDEDLQSVGMIAVCECVNRSISEGLNDVDKIQARANIWSRNAILQEIYKEKIKYSDDEDVLELQEAEVSDVELFMYLEGALTTKQHEIMDMLVYGYDYSEICKKLHIAMSTLYEHIRNIKKIILSQP